VHSTKRKPGLEVRGACLALMVAMTVLISVGVRGTRLRFDGTLDMMEFGGLVGMIARAVVALHSFKPVC
jgi:hypothetical protein